MVCCSVTPLSYSLPHLEVQETPSYRVLSEYSVYSHPSSPSTRQQPTLPTDQSTPQEPSTSSPHVSCSYYPSRQEVGPRYKRRSISISQGRGGRENNEERSASKDDGGSIHPCGAGFRLPLFPDTNSTRLSLRARATRISIFPIWLSIIVIS